MKRALRPVFVYSGGDLPRIHSNGPPILAGRSSLSPAWNNPRGGAPNRRRSRHPHLRRANGRERSRLRRTSPALPAPPSPPGHSSSAGCPSAFTPTPVPASSAVSRTQPKITSPLQPFFRASSARRPPTSAVRSEPPPSTTRTRPRPSVSSAWRTSALSSRTRTVSMGPAKLRTPPQSRKSGSTTRTRSGNASQRSAVRSGALTDEGYRPGPCPSGPARQVEDE